MGADVNARFDGTPLTVKLLREELDNLREASVPYNPIRFSDHGCALGAALALLAAGADPDAEAPPTLDEDHDDGKMAVQYVFNLCVYDWRDEHTYEDEETGLKMAERLAEALSAAGANFGADLWSEYPGITACSIAHGYAQGFYDDDSAWDRKAGRRALRILSRYCDHSGCLLRDDELGCLYSGCNRH